LRAFALLPLLVLFACDGGEDGTDPAETDPPEESDTPEALDGGELFGDVCAVCHAADGTGTAAGPDITGELRKSDAQLIDIMRDGDGRMPGQDVSRAEGQAIVDWMRETF
jgi:mono/diheme cytochrome c family protein